MRKNLTTILTIIISVFAVMTIVYAANTFPTTLNSWEDGDVIESDWANTLETKIGITGSTVNTSLDYQMSHLASLSRADTVTANWVNTAYPWADNEVADNITASNYLLLTGGTLAGDLIVTGTITGTFVIASESYWDTAYNQRIAVASASAWEGFYDTPSSRISVANNLAWSTNTLGVATNYSIPLTASISAHETFYDTPSNRITDGTGLTWSGNTLNVDDSYLLNTSDIFTGNLDIQGNASVSGNFEVTGMTYSNLTGAVTGNASTATALALNPADCGANVVATAIAANGDLTCSSLTDSFIPNDITLSSESYWDPAYLWKVASESFYDLTYQWKIASESLYDLTYQWKVTSESFYDTAYVHSQNTTSAHGLTITNVSQLGSTIAANELAVADFGDFTCNGTVCSLDTAYLPLAGGTLTGKLIGTTASFSSTFEISNTASVSNIVGQNQFSGFGLVDCDTDAQTLAWDSTNKVFSCGDDDSGGGVASDSLGFGALVNPLTADTNITFTGGTYAFTFDHASVSGNFEVVGFVSGTTYIGVGVTGAGDCNDATDKLLYDSGTGLFSCGTLADADIPDTLSMTGTWATTGDLTIGDGADDIIINSDTWDVSSTGAMTGLTGIVSTGLASFVNASTSGNFESTGFVSAATYIGAGVTGAASCDDATDKLLYDSTSGLFTCGTLADADIPNTLTLSTITGPTSVSAAFEAATTSHLVGFVLFGANASVTTNFEITGYVSASAYYGEQTLWKGSIASTSNEWLSSGRVPLSWDGDHYVITKIYCSVDTGTSVAINVSNMTGTYDTEAVTCDIDGASDTAITTNPNYSSFAIASSSLEIGTITGDVDWLNFTIKGQKKP